MALEKARMEHEYRMRQMEMAGNRAGPYEQNIGGEDGERSMAVPRWDNSLADKTKNVTWRSSATFCHVCLRTFPTFSVF